MFETRPQRWRLLAVAAALAVAALAIDTVGWTIACRRLDDGFRHALAEAGWQPLTGATHWGGWPIAAQITVSDAALRAGPALPPLRWTAARATLRLTAWQPAILTVAASGPQAIALGAAAAAYTASSLVATIDLTGHDPVRLAAASLDVAAPDGPVRAATAALLILPDGLSADLAGLTLPGPGGRPVMPIDRLQADAHLSPSPIPLATASDSARQWRDNGGTVEFRIAALHWGPLDATARATLRLDAALQPTGAGQITATSLAALIDQLAQSGAMPRTTATAAEAMLAILSAPFGGGPVTLPVALQDNVVSLARVPLLRLAPLQSP